MDSLKAKEYFADKLGRSFRLIGFDSEKCLNFEYVGALEGLGSKGLTIVISDKSFMETRTLYYDDIEFCELLTEYGYYLISDTFYTECGRNHMAYLIGLDNLTKIESILGSDIPWIETFCLTNFVRIGKLDSLPSLPESS